MGPVEMVSHLQEVLSVHQWLSWLRSHPNPAFSTVGHGMAFGLETGRLPNWVSEGYNRFFTLNYQVMSNEQMAVVVANAAASLQENTVAEAVRGLQQEMGQVVR